MSREIVFPNEFTQWSSAAASAYKEELEAASKRIADIEDRERILGGEFLELLKAEFAKIEPIIAYLDNSPLHAVFEAAADMMRPEWGRVDVVSRRPTLEGFIIGKRVEPAEELQFGFVPITQGLEQYNFVTGTAHISEASGEIDGLLIQGIMLDAPVIPLDTGAIASRLVEVLANPLLSTRSQAEQPS